MKKNTKILLTIGIYSTMFVIWLYLAIRYYNREDTIGAVIYSVIGVLWLIFGMVNARNVSQGKNWFSK